MTLITLPQLMSIFFKCADITLLIKIPSWL